MKNVNEIKSYDDTNEAMRKSDVVLSAIEKCQALESELKTAQTKLKMIREVMEVANHIGTFKMAYEPIYMILDK